ncbi:unnamed protein product [Urochloa humidicola]
MAAARSTSPAAAQSKLPCHDSRLGLLLHSHCLELLHGPTFAAMVDHPLHGPAFAAMVDHPELAACYRSDGLR